MSATTMEPASEVSAEELADEARRTQALDVARASTGPAVVPTGMAARPALTVDIVSIESPERAEAIIQNRIRVLRTLRRASMAETRGSDWTLGRAKDGRITASLRASGAQKVRKYWGISIFPHSADVRVTTSLDGQRVFEITGDAVCATTGEREANIRGYRVEGEEFTGRDIDRVGMEDLKQAARTALDTKAVRILAGLSAGEPGELAEVWNCTIDEVVRRCVQGPGFGKGRDRSEPQAGPRPASPAPAPAPQGPPPGEPQGPPGQSNDEPRVEPALDTLSDGALVGEANRLLGRMGDSGEFVRDVILKFNKYGSFKTEKQRNALRRCVEHARGGVGA